METARVCSIEGCSVRIELVKLFEYAVRVASVCNCVFCEDRTDETA